MARNLSAKEVCALEKDLGTVKFLKASISVINHILVERGHTTENELKQRMKRELHKIAK